MKKNCRNARVSMYMYVDYFRYKIQYQISNLNDIATLTADRYFTRIIHNHSSQTFLLVGNFFCNICIGRIHLSKSIPTLKRNCFPFCKSYYLIPLYLEGDQFNKSQYTCIFDTLLRKLQNWDRTKTTINTLSIISQNLRKEKREVFLSHLCTYHRLNTKCLRCRCTTTVSNCTKWIRELNNSVAHGYKGKVPRNCH